MKNLYDISKGQFIALWVFGIVGFFIIGNEAESNPGILTIAAVLIPFLLVFYTLGRRNRK